MLKVIEVLDEADRQVRDLIEQNRNLSRPKGTSKLLEARTAIQKAINELLQVS